MFAMCPASGTVTTAMPEGVIVATIEKALEIAAKAHSGVKDKQGEPYILPRSE